jgi:hypothetical protein
MEVCHVPLPSLFAATGEAVARLDSVDGTSVQTTIVLGHEHQSREGHIVNGVMGVTVDPGNPNGVQGGSFGQPDSA